MNDDYLSINIAFCFFFFFFHSLKENCVLLTHTFYHEIDKVKSKYFDIGMSKKFVPTNFRG